MMGGLGTAARTLVPLLLWALQTRRNAVAAAGCALQLEQNFNQYSGTVPYTEDMVKQDFANTRGPYKMLAPTGTCKISNGEIYGYFPKGQILGYNTGFTWYSTLPKPMKEAMMEYDIYFESGFDWTEGGKIPGLCGYDCPVGCSTVARDRGWSTRLMWRKYGRMVTYAYYPDKPTSIRCGEDWEWSKTLTSGRWHKIRLYVKMNTPGVANGVAKAWLDGAQVLQKSDVMYTYQDSEAYSITRAYITTYVGGSTVWNFAPDHNQYIKFDNFRVWEGSCNSPDGSTSGLTSTATTSHAVGATTSAPAPTLAPSSGGSGPDFSNPPKLIDDYLLYRGEGGWDLVKRKLIGEFKGDATLTLDQILDQCTKKCDAMSACRIFTVYRTSCYFRKLTPERPVPADAANDYPVLLYIKDPRKGRSRGTIPKTTPTAAPTPVPTPAPTPTPTPSGSSGLTVTISLQSSFSGGFCANLALANTGSSTCKTWTLKMKDDSKFQSSRMSVWGMTDKGTSGGIRTFTPVSSGQAIAAGSSLTGYMPGFCAYYADGSGLSTFDLATATAAFGWTGTCS